MRLIFCLLLLLPALASNARADVIYTLSLESRLAPGSPAFGAYSFSVPALLTTETLIPGSKVTTISGVALSYFDLNPISGFCLGSGQIGNSCLEIASLSGSGLESTFPFPLLSFGTYLLSTDITGNDVLSIADATAVTPEPASWLLLETGVLAGAAALRRRVRL